MTQVVVLDVQTAQARQFAYRCWQLLQILEAQVQFERAGWSTERFGNGESRRIRALR
ncbi:hypothetical protein GCM10011383_27070 [Hymenobacter cavernae]|uniref:Uncharacterized protein n=1 Tax=Hymenobacter cavernae TaxID=2044852 RepID=A0ABQ1UDL4_9BACT|nr:hypothetical protein GCM10011383_27070 [Hymenobacter cavernae]